MEDIVKKIEQWGVDKGIIDNSTINDQFTKTEEEFEEAQRH